MKPIEPPPARVSRSCVLLALAVIAQIMAVPVNAEWISPQRPLSDEEWLANEVSDADAVGVGHLLAVHDTIVDVGADGSGFPARTVSLQVMEWLKGSDDSTIITARVSMLSDWAFPLDAVSSPSNEPQWVVFMLRRMPDGWGLIDGPSGPGIRFAPGGPGGDDCSAIRRFVAEQSTDSLLKRADAVLVGRAIKMEPCISGSLRCYEVEVDRVLGAQVAVGKTVRVFIPTWDPINQPMLYVFRLDSVGVYERMGWHAGSQRLKDGLAERWQITVDEVSRRYKSLHERSDRGASPDGHRGR